MHAYAFEKALGPDHPNVGAYCSTLGRILKAKGDLDSAERFLRRDLHITEKAPGLKHPSPNPCPIIMMSDYDDHLAQNASRYRRPLCDLEVFARDVLIKCFWKFVARGSERCVECFFVKRTETNGSNNEYFL